jgi:hypothetical protein
MFLFELNPLEVKIVGQNSQVFGVNTNNEKRQDPNFYIALDLEQWWLVHLFIIVSKWILFPIQINYGRYLV